MVVPCGKSKVWDKAPELGAVAAAEAYTGAPFALNRAYAERFGDAWVVLSAKHGLVSHEFLIPGPYEVTFKQASTNPVSPERLRIQVRERGLDRFEVVVGLGGKEYRAAIEQAFAGLPPRLAFPFAGLRIGKAMHETKQAIASGGPGVALEDA